MAYWSTWFELTPAHNPAYLDPGTGSYAIQILLATLFGGLFALKQSWAEVKLRLSARFGRPIRCDAPADRREGLLRPHEITRSRIDGKSPAQIS